MIVAPDIPKIVDSGNKNGRLLEYQSLQLQTLPGLGSDHHLSTSNKKPVIVHVPETLTVFKFCYADVAFRSNLSERELGEFESQSKAFLRLDPCLSLLFREKLYLGFQVPADGPYLIDSDQEEDLSNWVQLRTSIFSSLLSHSIPLLVTVK